MNSRLRIAQVQNGPFSEEEKNLLTAAERYMSGSIECPLIESICPIFSIDNQQLISTLSIIWGHAMAAYHIKKSIPANTEHFIVDLKNKSARFYEMEYQRLLGTLFPEASAFWIQFYERHESDSGKIFIALDAIHFISDLKNKIEYQLLLQCLNAIVSGHYSDRNNQSNYFEKAGRLIVDINAPRLKNWISNQIKTTT